MGTDRRTITEDHFVVDGIVYQRPAPGDYDRIMIRPMFSLLDDHECDVFVTVDTPCRQLAMHTKTRTFVPAGFYRHNPKVEIDLDYWMQYGVVVTEK